MSESVGSYKPEGLTKMTFVKGDPVTSFEAGKVYVVECWATWCPPCRAAIPHMAELAKKYPKITFIGCSNEPKAVVEKFPLFSKMGYTVACGDSQAYSLFLEKMGERGIPCAFIINDSGVVSWKGSPLGDEFEKVLATM